MKVKLRVATVYQTRGVVGRGRGCGAAAQICAQPDAIATATSRSQADPILAKRNLLIVRVEVVEIHFGAARIDLPSVEVLIIRAAVAILHDFKELVCGLERVLRGFIIDVPVVVVLVARVFYGCLGVVQPIA